MREKRKSSYIVTIFIIVLIIIIIVGFFVPRNSFMHTESKTKNQFGQFNSRTNAQAVDTPGPLRWKKSFVYEKDNSSTNSSQSYMQYMIEKNKK